MRLIAKDECLAELVSHLSETFSMFSTEALKLGTLLAHSGEPVSRNATINWRDNAWPKSRLLRNT